jgi:hypothetical protein
MATNGFAAAKYTAALSASGNAGANSIFLTKINVIRAATVVAVLLNAPSATSSIQFKVLIYDGSHNALLATGTTVTSVASGYNRFPLTAGAAVSAGSYYVGYVCSAICNVSADVTQTGASWFVSGGQSVASPANPLVGGAANNSALCIALEFDGSTAAAYGFAPDYTSGVTIDGSNTAATTTSGATMGARSVVTQTTSGGGKYYAEVATSGTLAPPTSTYIGVISASSPLDVPNFTSNKFNETLVPNGVTVGVVGSTTTLTYVSGDVIGISYDAGAGLCWFNKNGGSWVGNGGAGDPVAGTNGLSIVPGGWPIMIVAVNTSAAATFTLRDTASAQVFSRPSGYSAWSAAAGPAPPASVARVMVLA